MVRHVTALCTSGRGGGISIPTLTGHIFLSVLNASNVSCVWHTWQRQSCSAIVYLIPSQRGKVKEPRRQSTCNKPPWQKSPKRSSGRPRQVLFTCGNLWGSRSYFPCPRWRVLHQGSRYRWHSGNSLGGRTSPGLVRSITEAREENQSWHCFDVCRQCHLRYDWTRVFLVKTRMNDMYCAKQKVQKNGSEFHKKGIKSSDAADKDAGQVCPQRSPSLFLTDTQREVAAQTLTMSMIRCPQALHLSADCWKPEYCNTQERLSSAEFHVCLKYYWPQSRSAKSVFNLTVSKYGWVGAVNVTMSIIPVCLLNWRSYINSPHSAILGNAQET